MSADNAIVIINFLDQSRVVHLQAIENLWYSFETNDEKPFPVAGRIIEHFHNAPRLTEEKAKDVAFAMGAEISCRGWLEYGILTLDVPKNWEDVVMEAWENLSKETRAAYKLPDNYKMSVIEQLDNLAKILSNEELKLQGV